MEVFRGAYGTELLTAAVAHLQVCEHLAAGPLSFEELRSRIGLEERPAHVLFTALLAMGVLRREPGANDSLQLTDLCESIC